MGTTFNVTIMGAGGSRSVEVEDSKTLQEVLTESQIDYARLESKGAYWTDQYGNRLNLSSVIDSETRLSLVQSHSNGVAVGAF